MKEIVISCNSNQLLDEPIVCCIGYFDGVHVGHQKLINETIELSKKLNSKSGLITFLPDPWVVIKGIDNIKHLTSFEKRKQIIESLGIDYLIILDFTKEMAALLPEDFISLIQGSLNLKGLVCGFDFTYGKFGKGNKESLIKYPFELEVVDSVDIDEMKVSSTRIVNNLDEGNIKEVNRLLGHTFEIEGIVVHGREKGRNIGFPTANIKVDNEQLLPKNGVYLGKLYFNSNEYLSMVNIGHNPTFNHVDNVSVEAHIIDFSGDLYDQNVRLELYDRIRDEKDFDSIDALINQLKQDVKYTKDYFNE